MDACPIALHACALLFMMFYGTSICSLVYLCCSSLLLAGLCTWLGSACSIMKSGDVKSLIQRQQ